MSARSVPRGPRCGVVEQRAVAVGPLRARAVDARDRLERGDQRRGEDVPPTVQPAAVSES